MVKGKYDTRDFGNIYRFIYRNQGCSRLSIAKSLHISRPTILSNLKLLHECGLIYTESASDSTRGRRPSIFYCSPDARYAIGIDITQNHISLVLINLNLDIINSVRLRCPFEDTKTYYSNLQHEFETFLDKQNIDKSLILGIGISLPAHITSDQKSISYATIIHVSGSIYEKLKKYLPYPFLLFNDANSAGLAESWFSSSDAPIVYLFLSNSVGGSLMQSGTIYNGDNWRACEFGHMCIIPHGRKCYCGKYGCLDAYCSAKNLTNFTNGNLKQFFSQLKNGNAGFQQIFNEYLDYLALALNNLRVCYDSNIILGGTVGPYLTPYLETLQKKVASLNSFGDDGSYVRSCHYQTEAAAVGAAIYYIDQFIESL